MKSRTVISCIEESFHKFTESFRNLRVAELYSTQYNPYNKTQKRRGKKF